MISEPDLIRLAEIVRSRQAPGHVINAAVIILTSVDTPPFESVGKILNIDKREVDRVQKAFLAGGVKALESLPAPSIVQRRESFGTRRATLVATLKQKTLDPIAAPRSQSELAKGVGLSKDHVRKVLKKAGLSIPSPYSNARLGKRIRELLKTPPQKHQRWTLREAAKALGVDRNGLRIYCKRFSIVFPTKRGDDLHKEILRILQEKPTLRPFWTDVELGRMLKVSRVQAKNYRLKFGIPLPPHPLETRIRAELNTPPREGPRWTYLELAHRLDSNKSWIREFCLKKQIKLPTPTP